MTTVRLVDVTKRFGNVTAVDNVSVTAELGELTSLLGPSGCGKTTTLRMIAGLEHPDSGEIWIGDQLVSAPAQSIDVPANKRDIGMVFQSYAVWPHKTAFENVAYPLRLRRYKKQQIKKRVEEVFALLHLEGLEGRYPGQLSGGQQQRVALGRAIVYESNLLLLDEPLANLDAKVRESVRLELRELQRRLNFTAVYVTHDQAEAMVLSDKIVVMEGGQAVQEGTAEQIYQSPATRFVADFVGLSNFVNGVVQSRKGDQGLVDIGCGSTLQIDIPDGSDVGSEVSVCIRPEDLEILSDRSVSSKRPNGAFEAKILSRAFQGNIINYFVESDHHRQPTPARCG